jgi:hypothetical protein
MTTLATMATNILTHERRTTDTGAVTAVDLFIQDAIRHYAGKRWWATEADGLIFTTVADTEYYSVPAPLRVIDTVSTSQSVVVRKTITAITKANPAVVTSAAHGIADGEIIRIVEAGGMTEVNGVQFTVDNPATNTFELSGIDSSAYTTYTSGGAAYVTPSTVYALDPISNLQLEACYFQPERQSTGQPDVWAMHKDRIRLWPIPDGTYEVRTQGYGATLPISTSLDTSPWSNELYSLIYSRARALFARDYRQDIEAYQLHTAAERDTWAALESESVKRTVTRRFKSWGIV